MQRWRSHLDLADLMRCPETKSARDGSLECGRRDAEPMQKRCQLDKGHEGDCIAVGPEAINEGAARQWAKGWVKRHTPEGVLRITVWSDAVTADQIE